MPLNRQVQERLDQAIAEIVEQRPVWSALTPIELENLLSRIRRDFATVVPEWIKESLKAKGIPAGSPSEADEWLAGPFCIFRNLRLLQRSIGRIACGEKPGAAGAATSRLDGNLSVPVLPADLYDRLFYRGFEAEVRLRKNGESPSGGIPQAREFADPREMGCISLVLGAGNASSIGPLDVLYKFFKERRAVLLKMHPVNSYLGPLIDRAFRALVDVGALRIVYGDVEEGEYLCRHPRIEQIHITGSDQTHDAIVFGTGDDGRTRKLENRPFLEKPISSELGNVSPVIVLPGHWTPSDLRYQAVNIASMLTNNAGFNCNATRVIIQWSGWPLKEVLLDEIRAVLGAVPTRSAYYPGAKARHQSFLEAHPLAECFGRPEQGHLPWTLIPSVDPRKQDDICFHTEAFCGLFAQTEIESGSPREFLERSVDFCNGSLWGTLNACLIAHPRTLAAEGKAVEQAIDNLRYGTVALNQWPAVGYGLGTTSWGAYPGHTRQDIQSGQGVVHNTYLLDGVEKAVVRGPFRVFPKSPWFCTNRNAVRLAKRITWFEADPSMFKVPGVLFEAFRG